MIGFIEPATILFLMVQVYDDMQFIMDNFLASAPEYRCSCGHLLFRGAPMLSCMEIKCHSCQKRVTLGVAKNILTSGNQSTQYVFIVHVTIQEGKPVPRIVDCSPSATDALGYTRDEFLAMKSLVMDVISEQGGYDESFMRYIETNMPPISMETVHKTKSGVLMKVRARLTHRREKWGISIYQVYDVLVKGGVILDDELRILTKQVPKSIDQQCEVDTKGVTTYVSSGLANYLQRTVRSMSHYSLFDFLTEATRGAIRRRFLDAAYKRESFTTSLQCVTVKGEEKIYDAHFIAHWRDDGIFEGYHITLWPVDVQPRMSSSP